MQIHVFPLASSRQIEVDGIFNSLQLQTYLICCIFFLEIDNATYRHKDQIHLLVTVI